MIGVFVMAYGGPNNLDEVEPYLLDVRGYRPTSQEIIHEVRERYREIGGRSPILEQTQAQADALESALNVNGEEFKAYVGMRHWHPFIKDVLADMQAEGNCQGGGRGDGAALFAHEHRRVLPAARRSQLADCIFPHRKLAFGYGIHQCTCRTRA
jgi:hypothetical protein